MDENKYGKNPGCGPSWFSTGKWDFFFKCCLWHDGGYIETQKTYARGFVTKDDSLMLKAIGQKTVKDLEFAECCRAKAKTRFFILRPFTVRRAELYIALVLKFSNDIWYSSVKKFIKVYQEKPALLNKFSKPLVSDPITLNEKLQSEL